ncbi:GNAT family N-acetyltransferase [Rubrobacter taiwanensis]|jgi:mycothiol synthase|uniref:GNAT family N-acetyltransferase n=1 Tax=Rubrobacter taiwanensis TaxID=185139 RepID=A0A4R1BCP4_9ACTN|nr:GNAT family N-acetyltransferase [Rubrobacter taiwanensis]TCJ14831.1 GNAT family N-acetyltransferase [Rubrobacter taiwanensis]
MLKRLPVDTASRPYSGEEDYARMRELLVEAFDPGGLVYATAGEIDWWRFADNGGGVEAARLWREAGRVVGFAWPSGDEVDIVAHPRYRRLEEEMLAWAERRGRYEGFSALSVWSYARDGRRNGLLERRGYGRTGRWLLFWKRELDGALPEPELPPGYALRSVRGEEVEERAAVHRSAFAPSQVTVEKYRAVMRSPAYRSDLDLVVCAPDGAFVAFCIAWLDAANRIGVFEPVGVHPGYRRRGLGRAVVAEGLRRLRDLGARAAYLNSEGANGPARRLYAAAGFRVLDRNHAWRKRL